MSTVFDPGFFHAVCPGGGQNQSPVNFPPLIDIKNRNQTLHDVRYTFEEFIC